MRLHVPEAGAADWSAPASEGADWLADPELLGSWSATRWQYAGKTDREQVVDVVAGLKGSVTVSLSAGAFVITWDVPGHGNGSVGGSVSMTDGVLTLRTQGSGEAHVVRHRVSAMTLALSGEESAWNFDGKGEVAAEFAAVLVRL